MNRLISLLLTWLALTVSAQTTTYEAVVIDAHTHQPLPYASIFISRTNSTITNAEGGFSIACQPSDVLQISYVGYKATSVVADKMGSQVKLSPIVAMLSELTVRPNSSFLKRAITLTELQLKKNRKKKANFFYRQTAYADSTCYEFMEAFLKGQSAVWLRNLALNKGRFAGIQPDSINYYSYYANFFSSSQIPVTTQPGMKAQPDDRYPLTKFCEEHYDISYKLIADEEDSLMAVHFAPKPTNKVILDATLYFDPATYMLRKMEGQELNLIVMHKKEREDRKKEELNKFFGQESYDDIIETELHFVVNMSEDREFLEVQSVIIDELHQLYGKTIKTHSLLFNIGDRQISGGKQLAADDNLHDIIEDQGYDKQFWTDNEIVLCTPIEKQVLGLFESRRLFGVF